MPRKNGNLTSQEAAFAEAFAATGDKGFAVFKAGYQSSKALMKAEDPRVMAAVERWRRDNLAKVVHAAGRLHLEMMTDDRTPAATRATLIKLAYSEWRLDQGAGAEAKEPHEMTADELAAEIARREANLRQVEAAAASRAVDVTPAEAPSIFD